MHTFGCEGSIQLFPDGTIFIHISLILLMIWVLNRTYFRPVNKVIESREKFKDVRAVRQGASKRKLSKKRQRITVSCSKPAARDTRTLKKNMPNSFVLE